MAVGALVLAKVVLVLEHVPLGKWVGAALGNVFKHRDMPAFGPTPSVSSAHCSDLTFFRYCAGAWGSMG